MGMRWLDDFRGLCQDVLPFLSTDRYRRRSVNKIRASQITLTLTRGDIVKVTCAHNNVSVGVRSLLVVVLLHGSIDVQEVFVLQVMVMYVVDISNIIYIYITYYNIIYIYIYK